MKEFSNRLTETGRATLNVGWFCPGHWHPARNEEEEEEDEYQQPSLFPENRYSVASCHRLQLPQTPAATMDRSLKPQGKISSSFSKLL